MTERSVDQLIALLRNDSALAKREAAQALGSLMDVAAVEPLVAVLEDDDAPLVRAEAAKALGQLGDARAVEPLIRAFKDNPIAVRDQAAYALGRLKDVRAVEPLISILNWDQYACAAAAKALGQLGDSRAVEPLKNALNKQHDFQNNLIHENAREALRLIGEPMAEKALAK